MNTPELAVYKAGLLRLDRYSPQAIMLGIAVVALSFIVLLVYEVLDVPALGLQFDRTADPAFPGIEVQTIYHPQLKQYLEPGDRLLSLASPDGSKKIQLLQQDLLPDTDSLASFARYNAFLDRQTELYELMQSPTLMVQLGDGREMLIEPLSHRSLNSVPWRSWVLYGVGLVALFIGLAVWLYRRSELATLLLAISGVGYALCMFTVGAYSERELMLSAGFFRYATAINQLGAQLFSYALFALIWVYPEPLGNKKIVYFILGFTLFDWLGRVFQLVEWPINTYSLHFVLPCTLGTLSALMQWHRARKKTIERAIVGWMLLSVIVTTQLTFLLYTVPLGFNGEPLISLWSAAALLLCLYLGMAMGVMRYRLFDLDRWWFSIWVWFFSGAFVICVDLALIFLMNLSPFGALNLAILIAGWVYFPIRQWMIQRYLGDGKQRMENILPEFIHRFFGSKNYAELHEQWLELLRRTLQPLNIEVIDQPLHEVKLAKNGLEIMVPSVDQQQCLRIMGREHGKVLFSNQDLLLIQSLYTLVHQSGQLRKKQDQAVTVERERIMRDLHDDVGAKLLSLVHNAKTTTNQELAKSALTTLREAIYSLQDRDPILLADALADWRAELKERLEMADVEVIWSQPDHLPSVYLDNHQWVNWGRILREAVTNALKHSRPDLIMVDILAIDAQLKLKVFNDGASLPLQDWVAGTGITNIKRRVDELGGTASWNMQTLDFTKGVLLTVTCPID